MYKIAIIGRRDSVLPFMALGFSVFEVHTASDAGQILHDLVKSEKYGIVFITEDFAADLEDEIARYKDAPLPAIVSLPTAAGSTGYGMNAMRDAVERAVGVDILKEKG